MHNTFGKDIIPPQEAGRLKALQHFTILKDLPETYFDNFARIIAATFDTPIALVSFVGEEDVSFPGNYGMKDTQKVSRGISLCSLGILDENVTVFKNAIKEPCLLANPLVAGEFGLRFYAAAPLVTKEGFAIGTVCIVDKESRKFTAQEEGMLKEFASTAMAELEKRSELLKVSEGIYTQN